jgi:hypothetical protein
VNIGNTNLKLGGRYSLVEDQDISPDQMDWLEHLTQYLWVYLVSPDLIHRILLGGELGKLPKGLA